jgi:putative FmdB family regulatory protein
MPIYTYRCENCGVQFDRQQSFNDEPLTRCPECRKRTLRKVFLPVGIVFKGSGFYATDHRSPSGARNAAHTEKTAESNHESKKESESAAVTANTSTEKKE